MGSCLIHGDRWPMTVTRHVHSMDLGDHFIRILVLFGNAPGSSSCLEILYTKRQMSSSRPRLRSIVNNMSRGKNGSLIPTIEPQSLAIRLQLPHYHQFSEVTISPSTHLVSLVALPMCTKPPGSERSALVPITSSRHSTRRRTYLHCTGRTFYLPDTRDFQRGCSALHPPSQSCRPHTMSHSLQRP